nr:hypothetical protein [Tanacetum cinerariifolium]
MMVHVLPNATSATNLAIYPVTVGVLQMPILLTSKKALKQVRRLHAMNVGTKGTTGEIVWRERTKTMKTKSKVLKHVEWCLPLEEEKPNKTLTTLRMRLKLKREIGEIPGRHCCKEKIVRVPSGNETLIFHSNGSEDANES